MITLTGKEQDKFALYCQQQSDDYSGILVQMEKVGISTAVMQHTKLKMSAYTFVANELMNAEVETIK